MQVRKHVDKFRYAFEGVRIVWLEEAHFRFHITAALIAIFFSFFLALTHIEFIIVLLVIGLVLVAEVFNTALEEFCDMVKTEHDPHVAKIKDLAAGAVFLASCTAVLVGVLIFLPHLVGLF